MREADREAEPAADARGEHGDREIAAVLAHGTGELGQLGGAVGEIAVDEHEDGRVGLQGAAQHAAGGEPSDELVAQLLALLDDDEAVHFTCGWADMSEKWGPLAQLSVTARRIVDQRWVGPGESAPPRIIALRDVRAVAERARGAAALFATHALVVALADGTTLEWEHLTNHQVEPAVAAIEAALAALQ